jgi:hypothetical protein
MAMLCPRTEEVERGASPRLRGCLRERLMPSLFSNHVGRAASYRLGGARECFLQKLPRLAVHLQRWREQLRKRDTPAVSEGRMIG